MLLFAGCNTTPDDTFSTDSTTTTISGGTTTTVYNPVIDNEDLNYVFDLEALPTITITLSSNEWNKLLTNFDWNPGNEEKVIAATFSFDKNGVIEYEYNIGFRIRGNSSRIRPETNSILHDSISPEWNHAHFKLDFTETADTNRFHKLRSMNLKWFKDDMDYCREVYNYNLFQLAGVWTAPRVSYARLYIKIAEDPTAAYFGVYEMIEPIDRSYLKARFGDVDQNKGNLWKCLWGANMSSTIPDGNIGIEDIYLYDDYQSFRPAYDMKTYDNDTYTDKYSAFTNSAAPQIRDFVSKLNSLTGDAFVAWITEAMDVDLFLKTYAVSVAVGMWDDYWINNGNNYYFYFANNGKAYFIPYDYDNSLGISKLIGNTGTQSFLDWNGSSDDPPLIAKILGVPAFMDKYKTYIEQIINPANRLFSFVASTNRIRTWQTMISPYVANDTGDDMAIIDSSATYDHWAGTEDYYLLTGDDTYPDANYFRTRIKTACANLGLNYSLYDDQQGATGDTNGGGSGYLYSYDQIYLRGSFLNSWQGNLPMSLVGDHTWQVSTTLTGLTNKFKFDTTTNWTGVDWGEVSTNRDGIADIYQSSIPTTLTGTVRFTFNDLTYVYSVVNP